MDFSFFVLGCVLSLIVIITSYVCNYFNYKREIDSLSNMYKLLAHSIDFWKKGALMWKESYCKILVGKNYALISYLMECDATEIFNYAINIEQNTISFMSKDNGRLLTTLIIYDELPEMDEQITKACEQWEENNK